MYKFEWTKEEADIIWTSLGEMTSKLTRNVMNKFQLQYTQQVKDNENGKAKEVKAEKVGNKN